MPHWIAQDTSDMTDEAYQAYSLQGVSRTFALTIPQLPEKLRLQVGNAYLLCRTCDTIEDEPSLSIEQKEKFSSDFVEIVKGNASADTFANALSAVLTDSTHEAERDLIRNTVRVIRLTRGFTLSQRRAIGRCVEEMAVGMIHYQKRQSLNGLRDSSELDDYCYYVAGVVGVMLTELFSDYSQEVATNREEMLKLAVSFGQGLQMTNILKDIWEDRLRGACWLPRDVFSQCAFDLQEIPTHRNDSCYLAGMGNLISVALIHLHNALQYTLLIPAEEKGIRRFCFWALGMALLTLRKLNKHRDFQSGREVKISRFSVKTIILVTELVVSDNKRAHWLFNLLAKGLPKPSKNLM
uniref:Farnesyl-diphosphate farnesyltransferase n=1 Tax=Candidatus Kentrum sp. TUN TaxID=2126343 RepID=A0A450ZMJ2_9GAMM|nr:MAG: farnesyl-diphosphate farnesyltransferase [Candidatus Kentron sp. TUN]VFK55004.1 MAG: farnesyl-diphosphate farnesyltransferase [Candidatus Kentron sp. TUN]VFK55783.1 MAG: farnesyl-diphosphate farnesyltransferase [Candidatus Kentron sp. TUN]